MDNHALNKITCNTFPDWYTQVQIDEYEDCMALGRAHVGKNITKNDEYLIEMASKMAINQKYGKGIQIVQEQLDKLKEIHKETFNTKVHVTPPEGWYTTEKNPLNCPYVPEILPHNNTSNIEDSNETILNKDIE